MNALLLSMIIRSIFVADTGRLTTGQAGVKRLKTTLVDHTQRFIDQGILLSCAIDRHEAEDPYSSRKSVCFLPPHNLAGSEGRNLYGTLAVVYEDHKEKENVYWIDKRHYSAFSGTDLDIRLLGTGITALYLTGVCTDICILHTAVDAYNLGYRLFIFKDAVASFDPVGHEWALRHFEQTLGATIL